MDSFFRNWFGSDGQRDASPVDSGGSVGPVDARKHLILIRGLQGSGKSTFAKLLRASLEFGGMVDAAFHYEADDWFRKPDGTYVFRPEELPKAHKYCQEVTKESLKKVGTVTVIVSNTFSQRWELEPFFKIAEEAKAKVTILTVETTLSDDDLAARNANQCPVEAITRVRNRWECLTKKS